MSFCSVRFSCYKIVLYLCAEKIKRMKEAFIKLHLSVLIAGGTGIFGRLITLNEGLLVWYRMLLAGVLFYIVLFLLKKLRKLPARDALRVASVGLLLAVHWLFFYGSIKASNVSIGVVCLSLMSFFTALFDPVINRHRVSASEILFSLVGVAGIVLIFHFDTRYRAGAGTILELNSAQLAQTQAQLNYSQAIFDYLTAKAEYDRIVGKEK